MFTNLKYSWYFFKRGGWRALTNIVILFASFTFLGTMFASISGAQFIHLPVVLYLMVYFDNSSLRFSSPLETTHLIPFPMSSMKKYLRLIFIESTGLKLYLILLYLIVQAIFNSIYLYPQVILLIFVSFFGYQAIFIPFLQMVRRKAGFWYFFRAFTPIIFVGPMILMRRTGGETAFVTNIQSFVDTYQLTLGLGIVCLAFVFFAIGTVVFKRIQLSFPFMDYELVEKFKMRRK